MYFGFLVHCYRGSGNAMNTNHDKLGSEKGLFPDQGPLCWTDVPLAVAERTTAHACAKSSALGTQLEWMPKNEAQPNNKSPC